MCDCVSVCVGLHGRVNWCVCVRARLFGRVCGVWCVCVCVVWFVCDCDVCVVCAVYCMCVDTVFACLMIVFNNSII